MHTTCTSCGRSMNVPESGSAQLPPCPACGGDLLAENPFAASNVSPPRAAPQPTAATGMPDMNQLQWVANYRHLLKQLRGSGIGSIIFGLIALGLGITSLGENPLNAILVCLGLLLLAEGIWLVAAPSPIGLIVDGIALLLIGIWNIAITALEIAGGGKPTGKAGVIGVVQFFWAGRSFYQFFKLRQAQQAQPSPETLKALDTLFNTIKASTMQSDPTLIEFQVGMPWKARLTGDSAVFINMNQNEMVFAVRDQVLFEDKGKTLLSSQRKASFRFADKNLSGQISPEALQRYHAWKFGASAEPLDAEVV